MIEEKIIKAIESLSDKLEQTIDAQRAKDYGNAILSLANSLSMLKKAKDKSKEKKTIKVSDLINEVELQIKNKGWAPNDSEILEELFNYEIEIEGHELKLN